MAQTIDYKLLAKEMEPYLNPPKVETPDPVADKSDLADGTALVDGVIVYTDPVAKKCDEAEGRALDSLPMGSAVYRGKNGTVQVNHSQESLEVVANYRRNRRQYQTRNRM